MLFEHTSLLIVHQLNAKLELNYKSVITTMQTNPVENPEIFNDTDTIDDLQPHVILFNDAWHTFDEVIEQLLKALHCSLAKAEQLTLEVHAEGKAVVFEGKVEECLRVSDVLEEIKLRTQVVF